MYCKKAKIPISICAQKITFILFSTQTLSSTLHAESNKSVRNNIYIFVYNFFFFLHISVCSLHRDWKMQKQHRVIPRDYSVVHLKKMPSLKYASYSPSYCVSSRKNINN